MTCQSQATNVRPGRVGGLFFGGTPLGWFYNQKLKVPVWHQPSTEVMPRGWVKRFKGYHPVCLGQIPTFPPAAAWGLSLHIAGCALAQSEQTAAETFWVEHPLNLPVTSLEADELRLIKWCFGGMNQATRNILVPDHQSDLMNLENCEEH